MNYFPNGEEEIELVKFIAKYQYLKISDAKFFFESHKYYKERIKRLIDKNILRRIKWKLVLGNFGIEYVKQLKFEYNRLNRNKKYEERLLRISNFAVYYHNCDTVKFIPSFSIKNKKCFTTTGRRFIGILEINGVEYLTYYISNMNDNRYIASVIYDMQKEKQYGNFIVIIEDINRINLEEFVISSNSILMIEDNDKNRERLKNLHSIEWERIIKNHFADVVLSERVFCDYTNNINEFISYFYFIDVKKLYFIKLFLKENTTKHATIVCDKGILSDLQKEIPQARFISIDCNEYVEKRHWYYV